MSRVRLDLHNHTSFSADGGLTSSRVAGAPPRPAGLDCIAVTDHNTVRGALSALELSESDPSLPRVIPGVEVFTEDGEVIGLYVTRGHPQGHVADGGGGSHPGAREAWSICRIRTTCSAAGRSPAPSARLRLPVSDVVEVANGRALGPRAGAKSATSGGAIRQAARGGQRRSLRSARWGVLTWS